MKISIKSKFGKEQKTEIWQEETLIIRENMDSDKWETEAEVDLFKELTVRIFPVTENDSAFLIYLKTLLAFLFFPLVCFWLNFMESDSPENAPFAFSPCSYEIEIAAERLTKADGVCLKLGGENPQEAPAFQRFEVTASLKEGEKNLPIPIFYRERVEERAVKNGYVGYMRMWCAAMCGVIAAFIAVGIVIAVTASWLGGIPFFVLGVLIGAAVIFGWRKNRKRFSALLRESKRND